MVGKTTMSLRNGSTRSPPDGLTKNMGKLTHDLVSLAEFQCELFRSDCREGFQRMLVPVALLLVAGIVALGTVPIALILMAELLAQAAGLSRAAAFSIATLSGGIVAVALGVVGWTYLRGAVRVFACSRDEWNRNLTWIKQALKRPAPSESQQPQER
jgi:Putative Actinobacterial Holin-X, holin superfamily III